MVRTALTSTIAFIQSKPDACRDILLSAIDLGSIQIILWYAMRVYIFCNEFMNRSIHKRFSTVRENRAQAHQYSIKIRNGNVQKNKLYFIAIMLTSSDKL